VSHLPLSPESRAKFNETAAQEFFWQTQGHPYGYHNFLFGWVDTADDNWPPLVPRGFVPILFSIIEDIKPHVTYIFLDQALNHRLGTTGLNISDLAATAAIRNMSLEDVMAIVEEEHWLYEGLYPGQYESYVCSAYVAGAYKAAGLLDNFQIVPQEQTPKDVYTMNVFDLNYERPAACVEADPDQAWCQLIGKYRMSYPGYSSLNLYDHYADHCPSIAPDYNRPDGC